MKTLAILISVFTITIAQKPGYLGSGSIGYPGLSSRFQTDAPETSVNNRLSDTNQQGTTIPTSSQRIPVDARGDAALVNRLNQWPRENRPFWVLNAEHIERQRNPQGQPMQAGILTAQDLSDLQSRNNFAQGSQQGGQNVGTQTIRPLPSRGSFAGSIPN